MCVCPSKANPLTGTLMPNSSNLSKKMIQSKKIRRTTGMTFYNGNELTDDVFIGSIQYVDKISFYYKLYPVPFYSLSWTSYDATYDESIKIAAIYLTLLSNIKFPNTLLFPFFTRDDLVYALGMHNGVVILHTVNPADSYYYAFKKTS
jgi:hypothetical protein